MPPGLVASYFQDYFPIPPPWTTTTSTSFQAFGQNNLLTVPWELPSCSRGSSSSTSSSRWTPSSAKTVRSAFAEDGVHRGPRRGPLEQANPPRRVALDDHWRLARRGPPEDHTTPFHRSRNTAFEEEQTPSRRTTSTSQPRPAVGNNLRGELGTPNSSRTGGLPSFPPVREELGVPSSHLARSPSSAKTRTVFAEDGGGGRGPPPLDEDHANPRPRSTRRGGPLPLDDHTTTRRRPFHRPSNTAFQDDDEPDPETEGLSDQSRMIYSGLKAKIDAVGSANEVGGRSRVGGCGIGE